MGIVWRILFWMFVVWAGLSVVSIFNAFLNLGVVEITLGDPGIDKHIELLFGNLEKYGKVKLILGFPLALTLASSCALAMCKFEKKEGGTELVYVGRD